MKSCYWLPILFLNLNFLIAQSIIVKIENIDKGKAALSSLSGENISFVDSLNINQNN